MCLIKSYCKVSLATKQVRSTPLIRQKRPIIRQKRPLIRQKRPIIRQKRPIKVSLATKQMRSTHTHSITREHILSQQNTFYHKRTHSITRNQTDALDTHAHGKGASAPRRRERSRAHALGQHGLGEHGLGQYRAVALNPQPYRAHPQGQRNAVYWLYIGCI